MRPARQGGRHRPSASDLLPVTCVVRSVTPAGNTPAQFAAQLALRTLTAIRGGSHRPHAPIPGVRPVTPLNGSRRRQLLLRTNEVHIPTAEPSAAATVRCCGPEVRNVALHRSAGGNEKVMRVLRFMILIIGMLGGAAGLSYATNAAPLPVSAATATQAGEAPLVTQARALPSALPPTLAASLWLSPASLAAPLLPSSLRMASSLSPAALRLAPPVLPSSLRLAALLLRQAKGAP
jgi:hypothetical protein